MNMSSRPNSSAFCPSSAGCSADRRCLPIVLPGMSSLVKVSCSSVVTVSRKSAITCETRIEATWCRYAVERSAGGCAVESVARCIVESRMMTKDNFCKMHFISPRPVRGMLTLDVY